MSIQIKRLIASDEGADLILPLVRAAHRQSPQAASVLNEEAIRIQVKKAHYTSAMHACWYAWDTKMRVAVGALAVSRYDNGAINEYFVSDHFVYVRESHRRQGIFKKLWKEAEAWANLPPCAADYLVCGVMSGNPRAVKAYQKAGFSKTAEVIMRKRLTKALPK